MTFEMHNVPIDVLREHIASEWNTLRSKAGAFDMFGSGRFMVDESAPVTVSLYTLASSEEEVAQYIGSDLYTANSLVRKAVSGTYPEIFLTLMENLATRL